MLFFFLDADLCPIFPSPLGAVITSITELILFGLLMLYERIIEDFCINASTSSSTSEKGKSFLGNEVLVVDFTLEFAIVVV